METASFFTASSWVLPVIFAITLHETAHGWMAEKFGDDTARASGRISINPLKHIDPVGTVLLPALLLLAHSPALFGYAKPVPVDFRRLTPPYRGMFAVAIAGPATNILIAIVCALLIPHAVSPEALSWLGLNFYHAVMINAALAVFNMLPILPLDGGRVVRALLPGEVGRLYARTERYGILIVLLLVMLPSWLGWTFLMNIVAGAASFVLALIFTITGHADMFPQVM